MTSIESITLEVPDPTAAQSFYGAFGLDGQLGLRASEAPTTGFRGFTLSLTVSQPANVSALIDAAVEAGATTLRRHFSRTVGVPPDTYRRTFRS